METKLSDYTDNFESTADFIINRFEERDWKGLGENQLLTFRKSKRNCVSEVTELDKIVNKKGVLLTI